MANETVALTQPLYEYLLSISPPEPAILQALREETAKLEKCCMQISPEQGHLMRFLVRLIEARKGIELGVFTGYSALAVALVLPEDGRLLVCDVSEEWTTIARKYWRQAGVAHKIDLRRQPATETLDELLAAGEAGTFDYAFIDADKVNQALYYEKALQLVRPGGLLVVDDTLWNGNIHDRSLTDPETEAIRAHNEQLRKDSRVALCVLPIGEGITLAVKRQNAA